MHMFSGVSDTNECEDKLHNCSDAANCVDVIGTFRCECFSWIPLGWTHLLE